MSMKTNNLKAGAWVQAAIDLDQKCCNIKKGTWGIVFGEANFYGDGAGPIVAWFVGIPLGVCNIYDGDIQ